MMTLSDFVARRLIELLEERRVIVWYDPGYSFAGFAQDFSSPECTVIDASLSTLRARRQADRVLCALDDPREPDAKGTLLIYCPRRRGRSNEERCRDPFEVFAAIGTAFGDKEAEQLESLARQAMPDRVMELERIFNEGRPTLKSLDQWSPGNAYPLIRQALGISSPVEVAARLLTDATASSRTQKIAGATGEALRLLQAEFGFEVPGADLGLAREMFVSYVLLSEFRFDLEEQPFPETLEHLPTAAVRFQEQIHALCDRLRDADSTREAYTDLARRVEDDLRLRAVAVGLGHVGRRDTFPFEERARLDQLVRLAQQGRTDEARRVVAQRRRSAWLHLPERAVLWKLAERCLDLIDNLKRWEGRRVGGAACVAEHLVAYVDANDGFWRVDRDQRLVEQGAAESAQHEEIIVLVEHCRTCYVEAALETQRRFLQSVEREGWPPEGVVRQTQTFARAVEPGLQEGGRVAYFLADALRFEMGRDLAASLEKLGEVLLEPAAGTLPSKTPIGMAALMPGADGTLVLGESRDGVVPQVAGRDLPHAAARRELLLARFGDRFHELELSEILDTPVQKLRARLKTASLLVVRTQDIDSIGETQSSFRARREITAVLQDLFQAGDRLARCGFDHLVYAADHGFILLPELPAGDVVETPPGNWKVGWRRCRLGSAAGTVGGVLVLETARIGIQSSLPNLAVPTDFRVFSRGTAYFHEGISLQENVIPLIRVKVADRPAEEMPTVVNIHYRSDRFTSRIVGLKLSVDGLGDQALVRLQVVKAGRKKDTTPVGEAADCDARDPVTGVLTLRKGFDIQVPIRIFDDFVGKAIEIRALDASGSGALLGSLKLKNDILG